MESPYRWRFVSFPKLTHDINVEIFANKLRNEESVLIVPGSLFDNLNNHFRLGFGRENLPQALIKFEVFTKNIVKKL